MNTKLSCAIAAILGGASIASPGVAADASVDASSNSLEEVLVTHPDIGLVSPQSEYWVVIASPSTKGLLSLTSLQSSVVGRSAISV